MTLHPLHRALALSLSLWLSACGGAPERGSHEDEGGQGEHVNAAEAKQGEHGGRLLEKNGIAVELGIAEDGTPPTFQAWLYRDGKPLPASAGRVEVRLTRLGGAVEHHLLTPQADGRLMAATTVEEPHSFDVDVVATMGDATLRWRYPSYEGRTDIAHMPLVHSVMSEDISFRRVLRLARYVEGAAVYFVHVSAGAGVEAIAEARGEGRAVYGETLHHYATFTAEAYLRPDGVLFHTYPSLKHEEDRQRLWTGLTDGTLSTVATDELCTPRAVKVRSRHVADANARFDLQDVRIVHRVGKIAPGEPIVFVAAASSHRRAAFEACDFLMDYLKSRAPFWKKETGPDGARWIEPKPQDHADIARWESPKP